MCPCSLKQSFAQLKTFLQGTLKIIEFPGERSSKSIYCEWAPGNKPLGEVWGLHKLSYLLQIDNIYMHSRRKDIPAEKNVFSW